MKKTLILAKCAMYVAKHDSIRKSAFTLAEVLITITIIGVVAAILMPMLLQNVSERIYSHREANIANKITTAMEVMITSGGYSSFTTTEEFVNALKKHLNIIKVCDNEHLTECWPTDKVKGADGSVYNVAGATTGKNLHTKNNTNTVGLILNDGASLILTYNPNVIPENDMASFIPSTKKLPIGFGKKKDFAYTSNATDAIDYVVDVNGSAGPNAETDEADNYHDIRSFRKASFSAVSVCDGVKIDGVCYLDLNKVSSPINCEEGMNPEYCNKNGGYSGYIFDYWAGAYKACDDLGMELLPSNIFSGLLREHSGEEGIPTSGEYWVGDNWGDKTQALFINASSGYGDWSYKYPQSIYSGWHNVKTMCYSH